MDVFSTSSIFRRLEHQKKLPTTRKNGQKWREEGGKYRGFEEPTP